LTERLERSFGAELPALAPSARALLQVAAADETDDAAEILAATRRLVSTREDAGPGGGGAAGGHEADVEAAVAARLLERDGVRLRFRHPLVRSAIYQAATDQERRAAHAAVAAVVGDPHRRAWHRAAARAAPDDDVAASLAAAAADARRRGAIATAAQGFARAADLSTTREGRLGRVLAAAELRAELGDADAAVALVARAEQLPLDPVARARILLIRETFAGDATDDAAPVRALLAAAEQVDADLALRLLLAAGTRCWWAVAAGAPVRGEVIAQTLRLGVAEDDPRVIAVLAATSAVDHAPLVLERLARACAEPQPDPFGAHLLGQAAHMVGQSELAVRQLARVEVQWRAQGRLALLAQALVMRAWSSIQLGNWPAIEPAAEEADRLTRETAQPLWEAGARSALAAAAGARGDYERTLRLAAEVDVQLANARPTNLFACLQVARGVGALGAARHAEAFDQFARMFDPADQAHHYAECHAGVSYLAEAALQCGRIEEARAVAEGFAALLDRPHATLVAIGVDVARAFIDETPVTDPVARFPFHRARVLLAEGSRLRRRRRAADSRAPLRTARDLFDALGTVPWAERARQELRASGERPIRRVPEARDELTPQELQIVRMAASGLSNPEIGERLFLSARTIGSHLYRAFPKLGVTSRGELAAALNDVN
jgi:DNA-binding CsgD family transcriptional regulator/tetratricopeptide (TPR) repeat protein